MTWDTSTTRIAPGSAVETASDEEDADSEPAEKPRADRPILVFIESPDDEDANQKIAKQIFDNNKVIIGSRFFKCVRMPESDAVEDPILSEAGKSTPRLVLLTPDYEVGKVVQGKFSSSKVYTALKAVAKKSYKGNFDKQVKELLKLPNDFDSVNDAIKVLKAKQERGLNEAKTKQVEKELAELAKEQEELEKKRDELMKMELRSA